MFAVQQLIGFFYVLCHYLYAMQPTTPRHSQHGTWHRGENKSCISAVREISN